MGRSPGGGRGWQGEIDDVRLYSRALSWGEVGSLEAGEGLGPPAVQAPIIVRAVVPVIGQFTVMCASAPLREYSVHRAPNLFTLERAVATTDGTDSTDFSGRKHRPPLTQ